MIFGDDVKSLFDYANKNDFAIPAVNVVGTNSVNAVLETAKVVNSPVIIQFSNGGAHFFGGRVTKRKPDWSNSRRNIRSSSCS